MGFDSGNLPRDISTMPIFADGAGCTGVVVTFIYFLCPSTIWNIFSSTFSIMVTDAWAFLRAGFANV